MTFEARAPTGEAESDALELRRNRIHAHRKVVGGRC